MYAKILFVIKITCLIIHEKIAVARGMNEIYALYS